MFILYDDRAIPPGTTEDAAVLCCADTLRAARADARDVLGVAGAIYQYDEDRRRTPPRLINERFIEAVSTP